MDDEQILLSIWFLQLKDKNKSVDSTYCTKLPNSETMSNLNSNGYNVFNANGTTYSYGGGLDSGDTAWMLTSTALVLLMTMPGLAIYYSGMVRDKNVLACKTSNIKNSTYDRLPSTNLF